MRSNFKCCKNCMQYIWNNNKRKQTNCTNERNPLRETIFVLFSVCYLFVGSVKEDRRENMYLCLGIVCDARLLLYHSHFNAKSILWSVYPLSSILYLLPLSLLASIQFACVCVWYNITFFLLSYPIEFTLTYINRSGLLSPGKKIIFISAGDKMTK